MKRFQFTVVVEISEDNFETEFESEVDYLLTYAFGHGDASGSFFTYCKDDVVVEDFFEEDE